MTAQLQIEEDEAAGAEAVLRVFGDLDLATAPELCLRLRRLRAQGRRRVVLDLGELAFCDSTGLRALFGEAREAQVAGARLSVVAPAGGAARRLFDLTGAGEILDVHDDVGGARLALALARR